MQRRRNRVCVILLNWNGKKDTLECLESLAKVHYEPFQVIVVDNASSDGSVEAIRSKYPDLVILETLENLGFAGGNNVGIRWALEKNFSWIFLLNNDTVVQGDVLEAFLKAAKEKDARLLGAKIYSYHDRKKIDHLGGLWRPKYAEFGSPAKGKKDSDGDFVTMQKVDYVSGCALFVHRSVFETIGLLEPKFFLYWEETDFCFRAKRAGFAVWTAPNAHVYHKVSTSFTGGKPHMHYFWWRSRLLWIERNCTREEKKALYRKVIFPELIKSLRHCFLKSLQTAILLGLRKPCSEQKEKVRRYLAGLSGAFHYFCKKFGRGPSWIVKSQDFKHTEVNPKVGGYTEMHSKAER